MDSAGERFAAIREALADRKNILTVKELCGLAGVSRSGYYNWVRSERARETRKGRTKHCPENKRRICTQVFEPLRCQGQ